LRLGYPGGPRIEKLAALGRAATFPLPRPRILAEPLTFSFSGLKTAVALTLKKHPEILTDPQARADLAAGFQEAAPGCSCRPSTCAATMPPWWRPWVTTCWRPEPASTWRRTSSPGVRQGK